jgi:hypothetical protein
VELARFFSSGRCGTTSARVARNLTAVTAWRTDRNQLDLQLREEEVAEGRISRGACIEAVPGARIGPPPVLRWGCRRPSYEVHHDANGSSSYSRPLGRAPARSLFERHAELADLWRWRDHGRGGQWRVGWRGGLDGRRRRRDDGRGR